MTPDYDYILAGAGAAGLLTAFRMATHPWFADKRILLIDKERKSSNDRTWCWWEEEGGLFDELLHQSWSDILIRDSRGSMRRDISPLRYKMLRSEEFYRWAFEKIDAADNITFLASDIHRIEESTAMATVRTSSGEFSARWIANSALPTEYHDRPKKHPVLQQHFIGWFVRTKERAFDPEAATFMDFSIPQRGNTRFMYVLPTSDNEALLEYTLFSAEHLPKEEYEQGIRDYLEGLGVSEYEVIEKEQGSIPMTTYPFSVHDTVHIHHIGTAGGWTKSSTGFTFKNAMRESGRLVEAIAAGTELGTLKRRDRFDWYDAILLDVLSENNQLGGQLFSRMFRRGDARLNLKFLDEQTNFLEELKVIGTMPYFLFSKTALRRLLK